MVLPNPYIKFPEIDESRLVIIRRVMVLRGDLRERYRGSSSLSPSSIETPYSSSLDKSFIYPWGPGLLFHYPGQELEPIYLKQIPLRQHSPLGFSIYRAPMPPKSFSNGSLNRSETEGVHIESHLTCSRDGTNRSPVCTLIPLTMTNKR